jgi:GT2 family glycosyltransferase/glycosyltransferase involved in cell wall biosynthesis
MRGSFDSIVGRLATGWAWDDTAPGTVVAIEVLADGRPLGISPANRFREDLLAAQIGSGRHAFHFLLPMELWDGEDHEIRVVAAATGVELPGSPRRFSRRSDELLDAALKPSQAIVAATSPLSDVQFAMLRSLLAISETLQAQSQLLAAMAERMGALPTHTTRTAPPPSLSPVEKHGALLPSAQHQPGERDLIVFSIIDWDFRIQRPQHLASEFARLGWRVFYLSVHFDELTNPDAGRFHIRANPAPGVFEIKLRCRHPHQSIYEGISDPDRRAELMAAVLDMADVIRLRSPIAFIQFPTWLPFAGALRGATIVQDCLDHLAGFSNISQLAIEFEDRLTELADVTVTSSQHLHELVGRTRPNAIVRNAAEVSYFMQRPATVRDLGKRPVIGYYGAISDWFDTAIVEYCARKHPDWNFVLVGSTEGADLGTLPSLPNVTFTGEQPYAVLTEYLYAFDVCIIPFKIVELIKATNPVKVYEYLCAGKPVVATAMPEVELLPQELVYVAKSPQDFARLVRKALKEDGERLAETRRSWAQGQSWAVRTRRYRSIIEKAQPCVSVIILCYNNLSFTKACLESVIQLTDYANLEIILVDNCSTDGTPEYLSGLPMGPDLKVVLNEENLGFAGGNNVGMRKATGEYVILLNNDTFVTPGWVTDMIRHFRLSPDVGMVGPVTNMIGNEQKIKIAYADMEEMQRQALAFTSRRRFRSHQVRNLAFFCVAISRTVMERVGLLDDAFRLGFFEDDDYCQRVMESGYRLVVADDVFVHHHLSASFNAIGNEKKQQLMLANKAIYERKWGEWIPHGYRDDPEFGE